MTGVARDEASAAFFDASAEGRLLLRRCPTCERWWPMYAHRCTDDTPLEWAAAAGTGTLVTWAVDHGPALDPALSPPDGTGTVLGLVEVAEGPWLHLPVVGVPTGELRAGMALEVTFVQPDEGEVLPAFTRA